MAKCVEENTHLADKWKKILTEFNLISKQLAMGVLYDLPLKIEVLKDMPGDKQKRVEERKELKRVSKKTYATTLLTLQIHDDHVKRLQLLNKQMASITESRNLLTGKIGQELKLRLTLNTDANVVLRRHDHVLSQVTKQSLSRQISKAGVLKALCSDTKYHEAAASERIGKSTYFICICCCL